MEHRMLILLALVLVRTSIIVGGDPTICDSASCEHAASLLQKTQQRGKQVETHRHTPKFEDMSEASSKPLQLATLPETIMRSMILPEPYPCDLTNPDDIRFQYCGGNDGCKSLC